MFESLQSRITPSSFFTTIAETAPPTESTNIATVLEGAFEPETNAVRRDSEDAYI
jgi:hypothetical protein